MATNGIKNRWKQENIAAEKKRCNSHNCAQAVLHTYADIAGISEDEAMNIAVAFGGGMGNMEGTCGALVGAGLVLGLVNKDKIKSMKQMRQVMAKFQERNGATQCKLLKGVGTKWYYENVLFAFQTLRSFWKTN